MSSKEILIEPSSFKLLCLSTIALLSLLLLRQSNWIWSSLYFQNHSATDIAFALVLFFGCIVLVISVAHHILKFVDICILINVCISMLLINILFIYLKQLGYLPNPTGMIHKVFAIAFAVISGYLVLKIQRAMFLGIYKVLINIGLIFTITPIILANTAGVIYWPSPSYQSPTEVSPPISNENTIILLLDELSASSALPISDQLSKSGLSVIMTEINPVGENTINVIPAIWMRKNFDESSPCGPTQLCSGTNVLDFSKVEASFDNIDIVGFFHRYCSIRGLRSCYFSPLASNSAVIETVCSFPGLDRLAWLGCYDAASIVGSALITRRNTERALMEAPFWQKGGILYAHLLGPHPILSIPNKSLSDEYDDNLMNAATLTRLIADKAKLLFGTNFRIVVFSDHPLRNDLWCTNPVYKRLGCKIRQSQISTKVPLIIASAYFLDSPLNIDNNGAVFDLLYDFKQ